VAVTQSQQRAFVDFSRYVLIAVSIVIASVLLVLFLWYSIWVLMLIFAGILLAVALRAMADGVARVTGFSPGWSLVTVVVLLVALIVGTSWIAAPSVADQIAQLGEQLPKSLDKLTDWLKQYRWGRWIVYWSPDTSMIEQGLPNILGQATGLLYSTIGAIMGIVIVVLVGLHVAADIDLYTRGVLRMVPLGYRPRMAKVIAALGVTIRRWLFGQFLGMCYVGVFTYLGLWMLDIPLAFILALLAFALEFVPNFGPIVSAVPAVLIAFVQSPELGIWVVLLYFLVQQSEGSIVMPLIQHRTVSLPPVLTITTQVLLGILLGPVGVLLATPLTAVALVLVQMLYVEDTLGDSIMTPEDKLSPEQVPDLPQPEGPPPQNHLPSPSPPKDSPSEKPPEHPLPPSPDHDKPRDDST